MQAYNLLEKKYTQVMGIPHSFKERPIVILRDADFAHLLKELMSKVYLSEIKPTRIMVFREM